MVERSQVIDRSGYTTGMVPSIPRRKLTDIRLCSLDPHRSNQSTGAPRPPGECQGGAGMFIKLKCWESNWP